MLQVAKQHTKKYWACVPQYMLKTQSRMVGDTLHLTFSINIPLPVDIDDYRFRHICFICVCIHFYIHTT